MDFQTHLYRYGEMEAYLRECGCKSIPIYSNQQNPRDWSVYGKPGNGKDIRATAISSVHSYSQGNPRLIDNVMTDAMTLGSQMEKKVIDAEVMLAAINNQH